MKIKAVLMALLVGFHVLIGCGPDTTAGPPGAEPPVIIAVYGDSRTGHDVHYDLAQRIVAAGPRAVFHTGDLVEDGLNPADWAVFNLITAPLRERSPLYPCLGNHENNSPLYFDNFELPGNERWYAVDVKGVRWIALDTTSDFSPASPQYQWLSDELKKPPEGITAVFFHHPPYSVVRSEATGGAVREHLVPLFERYGVDVVFSGHDHSYQRFIVNGVTYVVTGGGGAPLYDQQLQDPRLRAFAKAYHYCLMEIGVGALTLEVYDRDGKLLDTAVIDNRAPVSAS